MCAEGHDLGLRRPPRWEPQLSTQRRAVFPPPSPLAFFNGRSSSCFAGAIALAAWFPLPSPSPRSFPQTKVRPRATTSSGPLRAGCPFPLWGRATAGPRGCGTALVNGGGAVAGRRRAAPVVIARICLGTADTFCTASHVCDGRLVGRRRVAVCDGRSVLPIPRFFYKTSSHHLVCSAACSLGCGKRQWCRVRILPSMGEYILCLLTACFSPPFCLRQPPR